MLYKEMKRKLKQVAKDNSNKNKKRESHKIVRIQSNRYKLATYVYHVISTLQLKN
jgi:hypothetical protein